MKEYLGYYDAAFKSPDELFALWEDRPSQFLQTAPTLAADLRLVGRGADADKILAHAEQVLELPLKNGPPVPPDVVHLAYVRAAEQRDDEAVKLLRQAVSEGWIPDGAYRATDTAEEPRGAAQPSRLPILSAAHSRPRRGGTVHGPIAAFGSGLSHQENGKSGLSFRWQKVGSVAAGPPT